MDNESGDVRRLGKRELGRHAFEQRMPDRIATLINDEASQNKSRGVIPILATLLEQDRRVETAYLCDDGTTQIYKLSSEGKHFCGYRNIQMLFPEESHSIPELQDMIESAWDKGYNPHGRIETGGIKGTRKHIGTSEAEALLLSLNIPCITKIFSGEQAWHELLDTVEEYFMSSIPSTATARINQTNLSPVFWQRPGHSLTIVGIEQLCNGKRRLLTFDPAYHPPTTLKKSTDSSFSQVSVWYILLKYRRDEAYLKRYQNFEILWLDKTP